VTIRFA